MAQASCVSPVPALPAPHTLLTPLPERPILHGILMITEK